MSCNTLTEIVKDCSSNIGSIRNIYFLPLDQIENLQHFDYEIAEFDVFTPYVEYQIPLNSATYNVEYNVDEFSVEEFTHSITFKISKRRHTVHAALQQLLNSHKDLTCIVKDGNNKYWLLGYSYGLNVINGTGGSGTTKGDGTSYTFELSGVQKEFELLVPEGFLVSIGIGE